MPRGSKPRPCDVPGWPSAVRIADAKAGVSADVRLAAEMLARWRSEVGQAIAAHGWTQQQLGDRSGTSHRTISRTLAGQAWPELPTLVGISRVLGVALPGGQQPPAAPVTPPCRRCLDMLRQGGGKLTGPSPDALWYVAAEVHGRGPASWDDVDCVVVDRLLDAGKGWGPTGTPSSAATWE